MDIGMGQSGHLTKDRVKITEIIVISIILAGIIFLPLRVRVTKLPQGVKNLEVNNINNVNNIGSIGLPQSAVEKLKDLLKP